MLYRRFPKIPESEISVLGFGMMRLPLSDAKSGLIDLKKTTELVSRAFDQGVNYFDTAYPYHGGQSEAALGSALKTLGLRDKVFIADKCPVWQVKTDSDWERIFTDQLARLKTDYIDFYLLHALNAGRWETVKKLGGLQYFERLKKDGKIRHLGFSFHDSLTVFKQIVDEFPNWEFCQIQYNYFDSDFQAGSEGAAYAADRGIGVIAMEPLRGGLLANPAKPVIDIFSAAAKPRMPSEWALRWVWDNQAIVCALSGMNSSEQVDCNCAAASTAHPNSLPSSQIDVVNKAAAWLKNRVKVPCTVCRYCSPCPSGVLIPEIFSEWNRMSLAGSYENGNGRALSAQYTAFIRAGTGASACILCRKCESKCPQKLEISTLLKEAHRVMTV